MSSVRLFAFLIAVGMSVAFGYSLGESAGRRAAGGVGPSGAGVSQYQYEQMARQFSRTVYEQYAAAPDRDSGAVTVTAASPAPAARPGRPPQAAVSASPAAETAAQPAPRATPVDARRNGDDRP